MLRAAVSDVDSPPGFAEAVLWKGQRRRTRVRAALASAVVAVTVITGGVLTAIPAWKSAPDQVAHAADARLSKPTRGDLAGDGGFAERARSVWRAELPDLLPAERARRFVAALNQGGYTDPVSRDPGLPTREGWGQPGGWLVTAELPDRRTVVLSEHLVGDTSHLFAVLWRGDEVDRVVPGGPVNLTVPLPVQLRLPDGQGWIVSQQGSRLRWRSGDGPWTALPGDAALLPDQATHVEVDTGGRPHVVPLR